MPAVVKSWTSREGSEDVLTPRTSLVRHADCYTDDFSSPTIHSMKTFVRDGSSRALG
jgi:hypothetical protein